ncbi:hypothetical protein EGT74_10345 [Chitinophaga lutea]|uniref:VanZ-like domain-containing protein n=2 Tax=Chitinophaga lutea TaxID=2488634 RepID=A0A3N4Q197_9BACT|nr:hypothetical protein EGT74_10345 [Chitinophaga lutea]
MNEANSNKMRMIRYYLPALGWIILILFLCTMPVPAVKPTSWLDLIHLDKIVHFFLFGGTVILLAYGYHRQRGRVSTSGLFYLALFVTLYGLAIEFIQKYFTANRSFEIWDVVADGAGALAGALIFGLIGRRFLK